MVNVLNLGLRALEFLWTFLIMALVGNMIHDSRGGNPSVVNYAMFVAVISFISLIYLTLVSVREGLAGHPMLPLALDVLNMFFFFCGGVAFAAQLGVHSCGSTNYIDHNKITASSGKRCHEAQAATAFLWFGFACYAASAVFSGLGAGGSGVNLRSGGIRKGGPTMTQV